MCTHACWKMYTIINYTSGCSAYFFITDRHTYTDIHCTNNIILPSALGQYDQYLKAFKTFYNICILN